ncbi:hypothetical protein MUK42_07094 [Musa troglodytarum]|uniref:Uncharacterized protein n=2 Tax=Musa troglodytarum TaxID=320322 RepID=A0A9E7JES8_9LILI|nr:hypothetical protein MUK42_07094 [Musa troglodytarum]
MCKKCSVASLDLFAILFTLCSNGLLHDGYNVDELWLVSNIVSQRVVSIVLLRTVIAYSRQLRSTNHSLLVHILGSLFYHNFGVFYL